MKTTSLLSHPGLARLKLFWALSRTPHGLLDMATPGLCAMLWLGNLPPAAVVGLGLITAFSGYTAVYALNDVVDCRVDRKKIQESGLRISDHDLDAVYVRHPMAQGMLGYREGILWMAGWALLALIGSYLLNPACTLIFLSACLLEIVYCLLLKVSSLRGLISGVVKNSGGIAAVYAVDPNPAPLFLAVLFLWLFFWEIGGQNIPNDWTDLEEDRRLRARTIPVRIGLEGSAMIIWISLAVVLALSLMMFWVSPANLGLPYLVGALFSGFHFLVLPAHRLFRTKRPEDACALFNRASYYPLAMLLVTMVSRTI
jgi:4-hydroxybenzoate polyprenyltransferase